MTIFGKLEGKTYGDFVRIDKSHNYALVELLLAQQARSTLDKVNSDDRRIVIFLGHDGDGEYMGWRTGRDNSLNIIAEHTV